MPTTSNVQIHITTVGDIVLDQVINCAPNAQSPAISIVQQIPTDVFTSILTPFNNSVVLPPEFKITGVLIIPPVNSTVPYSFTAVAAHPVILYHPTNPSFFSIINIESGLQIYISHSAGFPQTYRFIWV